jgi:cellulose synthase/poly-beta-1,6-N-acetylglucosamine synthase-like glycosyltransferase
MLLELLFWFLGATVAWCYAGYPLFVALQARLRPRAVRAAWQHGASPSVTVVIAVRNEVATIARRIDNILAQVYPRDRITVIVACNGSTDGTEDVARERSRADARVRVIVSGAADGKAGALNAALAEATADLIVFADARQTFAPDAIARLVEPFGDETVGAVTGRLLVRRSELASVEGVRLYWGMETRLRDAESRSGSVVGATGAIYAIRRALFPGIPPRLILDDVYVPLRIAMAGSRVVMAGRAIAFDVAASDQRAEYARKRRTMVGNLQLIRAIPEVLLPNDNPLFLRFVSHKLLRLLAPFCFVAMLITSGLLGGPAYGALFAAQAAFYLLGALGLVVRAPLLSIPAAFVLVHCAVFAALLRWNEDASHVWTHDSRGTSPVQLSINS